MSYGYSMKNGLSLNVASVPTLATGGLSPSLALNFLNTETLSSLVTFTRASSGTRTNSVGTLVTMTNDQPRFDYDPSTLAAKGLLIEEQRTNLLLRSEEFDNASWIKTRTTISPDSIAAPSGALTADKIVEDTTATATHFIVQSISGTTNSNPYVYSIFLKKGERDQVSLFVIEGTTFTRFVDCTFNLTTGVAAAVSTAGGATGSASIENYGNGWFRCILTVTLGGTDTTIQARTRLCDSTGAASYTGNGTSGAYGWGAQLEAGAFATSYIPTVAAAATRAVDVAVMTGTNFSSWYNASEGTIYVDLNLPQTNAAVAWRAWEIDDGASSQRVRNNGSGNWVYEYGSDGSMTSAAIAASTSKLAAAYQVNNAAVSVNGAAAVADTAVTIVAGFNRLTLGGSTLIANRQINGHIQQIAYYPTRLPNATLQALTV